MLKSFKSSLILSGWFLLLCSSAQAQPVYVNDILIDASCNTAKVVGNRNGMPLVIPTGSKTGTQPIPADMTQVGVAKGCTDDLKFCVSDTTFDAKLVPAYIAGILPGNRIVYREKTSLSCRNAAESELASTRDGSSKFAIGSKPTDPQGKTVGVIARFSDGSLVVLDQSLKYSRATEAVLKPALDPKAVSETEVKPDFAPPGTPTPDMSGLDRDLPSSLGVSGTGF